LWSWIVRGVWAVALPLAAFLVLRPETYSATPNGSDPMFYTGYEVNFDDIMREIGDKWYFVSRWPTYMANRLFIEVFGVEAGRLILRWLVLAVMLLSIWALGRRWKWNRPTEIAIGVMIVTTPMFARAFMSDYFEWVAAGAGFVMVCHCLMRPTWWRSATIGALAAVILICNLASVILVAAPVAVYLLRSFRSGGRGLAALRQVTLIASVGTAAAAIVYFGGLGLFRWRYHIPDVYRPQWDFFFSHFGFRDPLLSPTVSWMASFVWIYAPAFVLVAAIAIPAARSLLRTDRAFLAAFALLAVQYAMQFADHFLNAGRSLELEYYWAFIYPPFLVASALLLGSGRLKARSTAVIVVAWLALLTLGSLIDGFRLPGGWAFAGIAAAVLSALIVLPRHRALRERPAAPIAIVLLWLLTLQIAAPTYTLPPGDPYVTDPKFSQVFFNPNSAATQTFRESLWFARELDTIDDAGLFMAPLPTFVIDRPTANLMVALYGVYVTGRYVPLDQWDWRTSPELLDNLVPYGRLLVLGTASDVTDLLLALDDRGLTAAVELDATHDGGLGYRAVVIDLTRS
jgi:hypothetical protein